MAYDSEFYNDYYPDYSEGEGETFYEHYQNENFTNNLTYPMDLTPKSRGEVAAKIVFYVITMCLSLVGNAMVIAVVAGNKRMHSTTNFYIVNLAVSDILVTVCCSWVHLVTGVTHGWILGAFFCKFNSFAQVVAIVSSILTLTLIACDRFFGIVYAMKAHVMKIRARYAIVVVWVVSVGVACPLLRVRRLYEIQWLDHLEQFCTDEWPSPHNASRMVYYTIISVALYMLPVAVVCVAYCVIIAKLWASRAPGERLVEDSIQHRLKKRVVMMLLVVLGAFALCWLPYHVMILYDVYAFRYYLQLPTWYYPVQYAATYLGYTNSAINPIIYAGFNDNFRKGFKLMLRCVTKVRRPSVSTSSVRRDSDMPTTSLAMTTKV